MEQMYFWRSIRQTALRLSLAAALLNSMQGPAAARVIARTPATAEVVGLIHGSFIKPPLTADLESAIPVSLTGTGISLVSVHVPTPDHLSPDHAKIAAFVARADELRVGLPPAEIPAAPPVSLGDWGRGWGTPKRIEAPAVGETLIVRGTTPDPGKVREFVDRDLGGDRSREILRSVSEVLSEVPLDRIGTLSAEEMRSFSERILQGMRRPRGSEKPEMTGPSSPVESPSSLGERMRARAERARSWGIGIQGFLDGIGPRARRKLFKGRPALKKHLESLPSFSEAGWTYPVEDSPVALISAALEQLGTTPESFGELSDAAKIGVFGRALEDAASQVERRTEAEGEEIRAEVTTPSRLEEAAVNVFGSINGKGLLLTEPKRLGLYASYDEARSVLHAAGLRGIETAVAGLAEEAGLNGKTYSNRLGGVLVTGKAPVSGAAPATRRLRKLRDRARYALLSVRKLGWYYGSRVRWRWEGYRARWRLARRFYEPVVADPASLEADLAVLGMNGEHDILGLRGFSHRAAFDDARAAFERHFGSIAKDADTLEAFDALLEQTLRWLPDHYPVVFAMRIAEHLRKAALLPAPKVKVYFRRVASPDDKAVEEKFRDELQGPVLRDFLSAADRTLREEPAGEDSASRVVGVVLTGSFARLAARSDSDFDVYLVTADGSMRRAGAFMDRLRKRWGELGRTQEIYPFKFALSPSEGLIQRVHKGPHVLIAPDPAALGIEAGGGGIYEADEGVFDSGRSRPARFKGALRLVLGAVLRFHEAWRPAARERAPPPSKVVAYLPGLESRGAYKDAGSDLWDLGIPEVREVYRRAAEGLGYMRDGRPDPARLFFTPENIPGDPDEKAAFIAAAFLTHNAALAAHMEHAGGRGGTPVSIRAYAGDSLGVLTAAVASGAISVADGTRIARFLLRALRRAQDAAPEPHHVLTLEGYNLTKVIPAARRRFGEGFEVYKVQSGVARHRVKVNLAAGVKDEFDTWLAENGPWVRVSEAGRATRSIFHSATLRGVRDELAAFLDESGIRFRAPRAPLVANNGPGSAETAEEVREALLAMVDEPMESSKMIHAVDRLKADLVVELGRGEAGETLFSRNFIRTPWTTFSGDRESVRRTSERLAQPPTWGGLD